MVRPGEKGYCKLCASKWLPDINRQLDEGWNAREISTWVSEASKGALTFNRQTLYAHRDNVDGHHKRSASDVPPEPPSTSQSEGSAPSGRRAAAPKSSNDEFLDFVRDHSLSELKENPSLITPRMGLEAVKILEARRAPTVQHLVLARVLTNQIAPAASPAEIVEGEYRELPAPPADSGIVVEEAEGAKVQ